jgi:hypothetical protein
MLGVAGEYGSAWDGYPRATGQRNAKHVDAAEALFGDIAARFRSADASGSIGS